MGGDVLRRTAQRGRSVEDPSPVQVQDHTSRTGYLGDRPHVCEREHSPSGSDMGIFLQDKRRTGALGIGLTQRVRQRRRIKRTVYGRHQFRHGTAQG